MFIVGQVTDIGSAAMAIITELIQQVLNSCQDWKDIVSCCVTGSVYV